MGDLSFSPRAELISTRGDVGKQTPTFPAFKLKPDSGPSCPHFPETSYMGLSELSYTTVCSTPSCSKTAFGGPSKVAEGVFPTYPIAFQPS